MKLVASASHLSRCSGCSQLPARLFRCSGCSQLPARLSLSPLADCLLRGGKRALPPLTVLSADLSPAWPAWIHPAVRFVHSGRSLALVASSSV
jgi:hypothetical protein